ncbi:MAG: acyl-CoA carboxylase subunit epsilon [Microbacteriaceae bacterium]
MSAPDIRMADIRVVAGSPSVEELAAVTAVLQAAAAEFTEVHARSERPAPPAWSRARRALRTPLVTGPGRWRSFSG